MAPKKCILKSIQNSLEKILQLSYDDLPSACEFKRANFTYKGTLIIH